MASDGTTRGEAVGTEVGSVLLERAATRAAAGRRLLFREPVRVLQAMRPEEVAPTLAAIEDALDDGLHVAGLLAYEAGLALEPALAELATENPEGEPLVWLGCYRSVEQLEARREFVHAEGDGCSVELQFSLSEAEYARRVEAVRALIAAGETYQANLTMAVRWTTDEPAAQMYARLLAAQPARYAAMLTPLPGWHIVSLSPELFFRRDGDGLVTRPMKGTAAMGMDMEETRARMAWLQADEKNRAENVMIVDLLRNDLGRICRTGSVKAKELFRVERYPSVLQMTSTVEGRLRAEVRFAEIFRALFPSGSIVGAPKVHSMRLLRGLETGCRGVYTGAIGWIAPDKRAEFNVAIRTVELRGGRARMGVGSGIVADSVARLEYEECRTKTLFLTRVMPAAFSLIETLLMEDGAYVLLEAHLERMASSAEYFDWPFDRAQAIAALETMREKSGARRRRIRLLLDGEGRWTCTAHAHVGDDGAPVQAMLWPEPQRSDDRFLRHKTTLRATYDAALREAGMRGFADALFLNERGEVTEGAIHNVILVLSEGWVTPPLASGVLPGVYRQKLLDEGRVTERVVRREELEQAMAIYLCNSVRGLRPVQAVWDGEQTMWGCAEVCR